jgi:hypothetical protein
MRHSVNRSWWVKFVELIDRIWPGPNGPTVRDDLLGELTHHAHGWSGGIHVGERTLDIVLGGPSNELLADDLTAARHILARLDEFEANARRLVAGEVLRLKLPQPDALCGFGAHGVHPAWRSSLHIRNPVLAARLVNTHTLGYLQFTVANDHNVLEVFFDGDDPIDTDYH